MTAEQPMMMLRARAAPEQRDEFAQWFMTVHLDEVRSMPGIAGVETGITADGTRVGFYTFEDGEAIRKALSSEEAQAARGSWGPWTARLEEFVVEIYAPLYPMPVYESIN